MHFLPRGAKRSGGGPAKPGRGQLVCAPSAPSGASHHLPRAPREGRKTRRVTLAEDLECTDKFPAAGNFAGNFAKEFGLHDAFPPPRSKAERGRCRAAAEGAIGRRHQVPPPVLRTTSPALRAREEKLRASRRQRFWKCTDKFPAA